MTTKELESVVRDRRELFWEFNGQRVFPKIATDSGMIMCEVMVIPMDNRMYIDSPRDDNPVFKEQVQRWQTGITRAVSFRPMEVLSKEEITQTLDNAFREIREAL